MQSITGRQGVAYRNIGGLISEVFEEVATQIGKSCRLRQSHSHLTPPPRDTPANIRMHLIFPETSHWPTFLSLIVWVYLYSYLCSMLQNTRLFCARMRIGRSRSFKVIQGRAFGTNRKRVCDFLLVRHCDYDPILHRFCDTATYWLKTAYFSYPSLIRCPRSLCSLWNFALNLTVRKLESWGVLQ